MMFCTIVLPAIRTETASNNDDIPRFDCFLPHFIRALVGEVSFPRRHQIPGGLVVSVAPASH